MRVVSPVCRSDWLLIGALFFCFVFVFVLLFPLEIKGQFWRVFTRRSLTCAGGSGAPFRFPKGRQ